jgi:hypothetical protein
VTADGHNPYGTKWCSAIHASSNPASSAAHPASIAEVSTDPWSPASNWAASRKIPNFMGCPFLVWREPRGVHGRAARFHPA